MRRPTPPTPPTSPLPCQIARDALAAAMATFPQFGSVGLVFMFHEGTITRVETSRSESVKPDSGRGTV